jgi:hypothetical protein
MQPSGLVEHFRTFVKAIRRTYFYATHIVSELARCGNHMCHDFLSMLQTTIDDEALPGGVLALFANELFGRLADVA